MVEGMAKQVSWTKEDREKACMIHAITGNMAQTAMQTQIPRTTLIRWSNTEEWVLLQVTIGHEKRTEHIASYNKMVDLAQTKAIELIPNITSAREATLVACMAQDKGELLSGRPTSRSDSGGSMRQLADEFAKLSDEMHRERTKRVVHTQDKADPIPTPPEE